LGQLIKEKKMAKKDRKVKAAQTEELEKIVRKKAEEMGLDDVLSQQVSGYFVPLWSFEMLMGSLRLRFSSPPPPVAALPLYSGPSFCDATISAKSSRMVSHANLGSGESSVLSIDALLPVPQSALASSLLSPRSSTLCSTFPSLTTGFRPRL
jgi:hypothetical protein